MRKTLPTKKRKQVRAPLSEINVTPLVDVMLVLLIVFMITAPLLTVGVPVNLPETKASKIQKVDKPVVISMDKNEVIYFQDKVVNTKQLVALLKVATKNNTKTSIFIRGDKSLKYGSIMKLMGTISANGYKNVALLSQIPKK